MRRTFILYLLVLSCVFSGVAYAASGGVPQAQESTNPPENVADTSAVQPEKDSRDFATHEIYYSDNTVSLKDYLEIELKRQWWSIGGFISLISVFIAIFTVINQISLTRLVTQAENELKNIRDEKEKAHAIVEEGQEQITNTVTEGQKHLDQLCNDAEDRFKKLIEQDMKMKFMELMAQVKRQIEDIENKKQLLEKLIESAKTSKELTPAEKKEVKKTVEDITKIPEKDRTAYDYFILAYNAIDFDEKIELYSKAIKLDPDDAYAYNNRGNARLVIKDYSETIIDCDKAIELDPGLETAYCIKACALSMLGFTKKALEQLEIAAENGYSIIEFVRKEKTLDSLRENQRFDEIMKKIEENAKKEQK